VALAGAVAFIALSSSPMAKADAQSSDAAISQGYQTKAADIEAGDLVSLDPSNQAYIELANSARTRLLLGVVEDKPLVALSTSVNQVQVTTGGVAPALVSDMNGAIQLGDKVTTSPINGVGMKATTTAEIVGTAQEDLSAVKTVPFSIKDTHGNKRTVRIGMIPIQVSVAYYTVSSGQTTSTLPSFVQQTANAVAGHSVSAVRSMISLLVVLLGVASAGVILYSSIRSTIVGVGRNPLAVKSIRRGLYEVALMTAGILLAMVISVYFVLVT
jgi:hypothetical protein